MLNDFAAPCGVFRLTSQLKKAVLKKLGIVLKSLQSWRGVRNYPFLRYVITVPEPYLITVPVPVLAEPNYGSGSGSGKKLRFLRFRFRNTGTIVCVSAATVCQRVTEQIFGSFAAFVQEKRE